jgi:hypothetical protein
MFNSFSSTKSTCCSTKSSNIPHPGRIAACPAPDLQQPATKATHTIGGNNIYIVSSSWWCAQKCPKHVEHIINAIKHSVASSWFFFSTQCEITLLPHAHRFPKVCLRASCACLSDKNIIEAKLRWRHWWVNTGKASLHGESTPATRGVSSEPTALTKNLQNIQDEQADQPTKKCATPHRVHVLLCWTSVVGSNSFFKMYVYGKCFVHCYRAHYGSKVLNLWSWWRRFSRLCTQYTQHT